MPKISVLVWPSEGAHSILRYIPYLYKNSHAALVVWDGDDNIAAYLSFYPGVVRGQSPGQEKRCCANADKYASHFHHYQDDGILKIDGNWVFPAGVRVIDLNHPEINVDRFLTVLENIKIDQEQQWGVQSNCSDLVLYALRQGIPPSDFSKPLYEVSNSVWLDWYFISICYMELNPTRHLYRMLNIFFNPRLDFYSTMMANLPDAGISIIAYSCQAFFDLEQNREKITLVNWQDRLFKLIKDKDPEVYAKIDRVDLSGKSLKQFYHFLGRAPLHKRMIIGLPSSLLMRVLFSCILYKKLNYPKIQMQKKIKQDCFNMLLYFVFFYSMERLEYRLISILPGILSKYLDMASLVYLYLSYIPIWSDFINFKTLSSLSFLHQVVHQLQYTVGLRVLWRFRSFFYLYDQVISTIMTFPVPGFLQIRMVIASINSFFDMLSFLSPSVWLIRALCDLNMPNNLLKIVTILEKNQQDDANTLNILDSVKKILPTPKQAIKHSLIASGLFVGAMGIHEVQDRLMKSGAMVSVSKSVFTPS